MAIKSLTPEEYEVIMSCIDELKANAKLYACEFGLAATVFSYWQRRFIPRTFIFFSILVGAGTGAAFGAIRTGWYLVEKVDALGKDYEISRLMK